MRTVGHEVFFLRSEGIEEQRRLLRKLDPIVHLQGMQNRVRWNKY